MRYLARYGVFATLVSIAAAAIGHLRSAVESTVAAAERLFDIAFRAEPEPIPLLQVAGPTVFLRGARPRQRAYRGRMLLRVPSGRQKPPSTETHIGSALAA